MIAATPAERMLMDLGITEPKEIDLDAIAYTKGAVVNYRPMDGCEASIVGSKRRAVISVNSRSMPERRRFPYAIVVIGFGNVTLQAVLPAPSKDSLFSEDLLVPPPHPTPHVGRPWPYSFETTERINLNWPEKVRGKIREVRMNATLVSKTGTAPPAAAMDSPTA